MITIWKYEIYDIDVTISVKTGTTPLYVAKQFGKLFVWCRVDTEQAITQNLAISIRGTGTSVPDNANYLGSFQEESGIFIFHVFWKVEAV